MSAESPTPARSDPPPPSSSTVSVRTRYTLSPRQWWGRVAASILLTATGCALVDTAISLAWPGWLFVVGLIVTGVAAVLTGMAFLSWRSAMQAKTERRSLG